MLNELLPYVQEVVTPFDIGSYNIKWVTTSWTYSRSLSLKLKLFDICLYELKDDYH